MPGTYPPHESPDWDIPLKAYIDAGDADALAAASSATETAEDAGEAAQDASEAAAAASASATTANNAAAAAMAAAQAAAVKQIQYVPNPLSRTVTPDTAVVTLGAAADGAYNEAYALSGGALPAIWPVDAFGKMQVLNGTWAAVAPSGAATVTTFRFMTDSDSIALSVYVGTSGFQMSLFVDGQPFSGNPYTPAITSGFSPFGLQTIVFNTGAKPEGRLIEIRMVDGLAGIYVKKPYRVWKPTPNRNPKICVVGDSYVLPYVMNDASAGQVTVGGYDAGIYQQMNEQLGLTSLTTDGIGGSGFIMGGTASMPYGHATRLQWLADLQPDVVLVHGDGANDRHNGYSVSQIVNAAVPYISAVRGAVPSAKIGYLEGWAPPGFNPSVFNPDYIAIRQGVQAGVSAAGVKMVYYLDIATTRPPLNGTGYVTNPQGDGNSDYLVGSDGIHLTAKGNKYARGVIAPKVARMLADDGRLAGSLIL